MVMNWFFLALLPLIWRWMVLQRFKFLLFFLWANFLLSPAEINTITQKSIPVQLETLQDSGPTLRLRSKLTNYSNGSNRRNTSMDSKINHNTPLTSITTNKKFTGSATIYLMCLIMLVLCFFMCFGLRRGVFPQVL